MNGAGPRAHRARLPEDSGDEDGAQMEFDAAQETFERLGAAPMPRAWQRFWRLRHRGVRTGR